MKRLHKFIISSFLGPFVLTFFIVIFLLLMQFLWKYIDDLAGKGLQLGILCELMFYTASSLVPMAVPLAVLMASLMTMGSLGENFELIAMKASGISLQRIVYPLIIFCVILSVLAFLFANYILPVTNLKMTALIVDITHKKPELQIREGIFYNGIDGYSIRIGKKDYKSGLLRQIKIYDHTSGMGNTSVTAADSGYIKMTTDKQYLLVTLYNGYNYSEVQQEERRGMYAKKTYPFRRDHFQKEEIRIKLVGFDLVRSDESIYRQSYKMLSLRQLNSITDSMEHDINQKSRYLYNSIKNNQLFRYKPRNIPRLPHDTATKRPMEAQNFDSLFDSLPFSDKSTLVSEAISYSRDAKAYILSNLANRQETDMSIRKYEIEWWRKFTLSAACFIFFFIGAPLGAIIRKGGLGMPVVISVLFFVMYYVISIFAEKFAKEGELSPALGMWVSSIVLLPVGIFLTHKATRESSMLNFGSYIAVFKNIVRFLGKKKNSNE